jgi:hypothetical protein
MKLSLAKINEYDKVRIRDFINVILFQIKEQKYVQAIIDDPSIMEGQEIEDGIYLRCNGKNKHVEIDYEKNQFKFMPSSSELSLFKVPSGWSPNCIIVL